MSKGNYLENVLLDHVLGGGDYTRVATVYVALLSWTDEAGYIELSGGNYARVAVTNNATNWPAASSGVKSNGTAIEFVEADASWGTANIVGILDASDVLLYHSTLTASRAVVAGDIIRFPIGSIVLTED